MCARNVMLLKNKAVTEASGVFGKIFLKDFSYHRNDIGRKRFLLIDDLAGVFDIMDSAEHDLQAFVYACHTQTEFSLRF
jgi:hypothetical protein